MGRAKFTNNTDGTQTVYNADGTVRTIGDSTNQTSAEGGAGFVAEPNFNVGSPTNVAPPQGVGIELIDDRTAVQKDSAGDVARYRGMAQVPNKSPPIIDATRTNETRGVGMDALSMLRARAEGAETPADVQARKQTTGAVQGVYSGAASVRGGAGARAAAARGAVAGGARVQAQGDQDAAALHARGMAGAAGEYTAATTAQRGADLGLASSQADLVAGTREADLQRQQYYERLGLQRKGITADYELGRSDSDSAAANSAAQFAQQQGAAQRARDDQYKATAASTVAGGIQGYSTANPAPAAKPQPGPGQAGYSETGGYGTPDYKGDTSDVRAKTAIRSLSTSGVDSKTAIHPLSDKNAADLARRFGGATAGYKASLDAGPSVKGGPERAAEGPAYDGKYLSSPFAEKTKKQNLDEAIGARVEQDKKETAARESTPKYGYFKSEDGGAGGTMPDREKLGHNPFYAASRERQPGYMFGGAPQAKHGYEPAAEPVVHEGARGERDREVMLSDDKSKIVEAKREAFEQGANYSLNLSKDGSTPEDPLPDYVQGKYRGASSGGKASGTASYSRKDAGPQRATVASREKTGEGARQAITSGLAMAPMSPIPAAGVVLGGARAAYHAEGPNQAPMPVPPPRQDAPAPVQPSPDVAQPGYLSQLAARARNGMPSDEKTKAGERNADPMADAMRSMEPSIYEYKPKYAAEAGQSPHEKNVGPMANKMKKDRIASTAIMERPDGMLAIDKDKALKLALGGLSDLQMQVDDMKKRRSA